MFLWVTASSDDLSLLVPSTPPRVRHRVVAPPEADASIGCILWNTMASRERDATANRIHADRENMSLARASRRKLELRHFAVGQHLAGEMEEERAVTDDGNAALRAREKK